MRTRFDIDTWELINAMSLEYLGDGLESHWFRDKETGATIVEKMGRLTIDGLRSSVEESRKRFSAKGAEVTVT